ncbi:hypothetical protein BKA62DRAFT_829218 [Auriculariales sp. MPI-PUGE-AT-0066]|nr:hypothetical protein BKA62DRAFT_829218 [Auriculariales sp. MPI-PUGE-AT-0066]
MQTQSSPMLCIISGPNPFKRGAPHLWAHTFILFPSTRVVYIIRTFEGFVLDFHLSMRYTSIIRFAVPSIVALATLVCGAPVSSQNVASRQNVPQIPNVTFPDFVKVSVFNPQDHETRDLRTDGTFETMNYLPQSQGSAKRGVVYEGEDPEQAASKFRMTLVSDKVEPWPLEPHTVASTVRLAAVTDSATGEVIEKPCALVHGVFTCDLHRWFKPEEIDNLPSTATDFRILHQDPAVEPIEVRNAQLLGPIVGEGSASGAGDILGFMRNPAPLPNEAVPTDVLTPIGAISHLALAQVFALN